VAAWRNFKSVHFTYQAELGPAGMAARNPRLGIGRIAERAAGPEELRFEIGDWSTLGVGPGEKPFFFQDDPPRPELADYLRRSIRVFFCFPFNLADPVWAFERSLLPGERPDPWGFSLIPVRFSSPHPVYRVELDPGTGLPRAVYYQVDHPYFEGKIFQAVFSGYRMVQGLRLATEITHYPCDQLPEPGGNYPWENSPRAAVGAGGKPMYAAFEERGEFVLRERIWNIELEEKPPEEEAPAGEAPDEEPIP